MITVNARIIWDGFNLDWPSSIGLTEYTRQPLNNKTINRAQGGKAEVIVHAVWDAATIGAIWGDANRQFYRDFKTFWSHASKGREFAFAANRDDTIDTLLDVAVSKTDTLIPLASTAGIVVDGFYMLKSLITLDDENVQVQSIDDGVSVTIYAPGAHFDFENGAVFRSEDYHPHLIAVDKKLPEVEKKSGKFELKFKVEENPEL